MCTVSINIDEATMQRINPCLTSRESIGLWLQHQVDLMLEEMMVADDEKTMGVEELRTMLHTTVRENYSSDRTKALERDMTPEQLYALISEEIDDIYANG